MKYFIYRKKNSLEIYYPINNKNIELLGYLIFTL